MKNSNRSAHVNDGEGVPVKEPKKQVFLFPLSYHCNLFVSKGIITTSTVDIVLQLITFLSHVWENNKKDNFLGL